MKARTFDRKFDAGEDIVDHLDLSKARRVGNDAKRVNAPAQLCTSKKTASRAKNPREMLRPRYKK